MPLVNRLPDIPAAVTRSLRDGQSNSDRERLLPPQGEVRHQRRWSLPHKTKYLDRGSNECGYVRVVRRRARRSAQSAERGPQRGERVRADTMNPSNRVIWKPTRPEFSIAVLRGTST